MGEVGSGKTTLDKKAWRLRLRSEGVGGSVPVATPYTIHSRLRPKRSLRFSLRFSLSLSLSLRLRV